MAELQQRFGAVAEFAVIYLAEAHAADEWPMGDHVVLDQPKVIEERLGNARAFMEGAALAPPLAVFVDSMSNDFLRLFSAHPERYFVIVDRRLAWKSQPSGLGGYNLDELAQFLDELAH